MEKILVLDFGGQYNQLIARRVRECCVYSEVLPYTTPLDTIRNGGYKGIIFTGGPNSVLEENAPKCDPQVLTLGIPVLGICYGAQLMAVMLGGAVAPGDKREYGNVAVRRNCGDDLLFADVPEDTTCWMSHTYSVSRLPEGFRVTLSSDSCPAAAMENAAQKLYAVQFHPEVAHTPEGQTILQNFVFRICGCKGDWQMSSFVSTTVASLRETIGDKTALCALSGGVDSSVAAALLERAIGDRLTCIFVDHGLLRKGEAEQVRKTFTHHYHVHLISVDASDRFFKKLAGVSDPEQKRKIIGEEFIRIFEEEAHKIGAVDYLVQGTIYPDVIESGAGDAALIKSHHNVGGLPEIMDFKAIVEPLRNLFKDEVRRVGLEVGMPEEMVWRQPFPGPGLGIRVIGAVTPEKADILREADAIFREEIAKAGLHRSIGQFFAVLTNMRSVGVMGDGRTYDYTVALRAVTTTDFMTADFARIPYDVLEVVSARIVNEVRQVNRVVYDITTKPPATIEWE